jgi:hypothetical protein
LVLPSLYKKESIFEPARFLLESIGVVYKVEDSKEPIRESVPQAVHVDPKGVNFRLARIIQSMAWTLSPGRTGLRFGGHKLVGHPEQVP